MNKTTPTPTVKVKHCLGKEVNETSIIVNDVENYSIYLVISIDEEVTLFKSKHCPLLYSEKQYVKLKTDTKYMSELKKERMFIEGLLKGELRDAFNFSDDGSRLNRDILEVRESLLKTLNDDLCGLVLDAKVLVESEKKS